MATHTRVSRKHLLLAIGSSFLLGVAVTVLLRIAYPHGFIAPDTREYWQVALSLKNPSMGLMDQVRGPGLGLLMLIAAQTAEPGGFILVCNALLLSLGLALTAWVATLLLQSARAGFFCALLLLCVDILVGEPFFYTTFVLSDSAAAGLLFAGLLLVMGGWIHSSKWLMFAGCVLLGLSEIVRSMFLIPFFGTIGILLIFWSAKKPRSWLWLLSCLCGLLLPIMGWNVRNAVIFGKAEPNFYVHMHLLTQAEKLWGPQDIIFPDPEVNAAFWKMLETGVLPPEYKGPPIFPSTYSPWNMVLPFISSQVPLYKSEGWKTGTEAIRAEYQRQFLDICKSISIRTILHHPRRYVLHVLQFFVLQFHHEESNYLLESALPSSRHAYERIANDRVIDPALKKIFMGGTPWVVSDWSQRAAAVLYLLMIGLRMPLPYYEQIFFTLSHASLVFGCLLVWSGRTRRFVQMEEDGRLAGIVLIVLYATAAVHYLAIALMTAVVDSRYGTPGVYPLRLSILLTLFILLPALWRRIRLSFFVSRPHPQMLPMP